MGILYVAATPLGNLKDITLRALETLKEADFIICEDTRQTIKLLNHYGISKPLIGYFQHSKFSKIEQILDLLKQGKTLVLVTDAGTPGISDPGGKLIETIISQLPEVSIIPIPGPSAVIAALSVSGFPADKFIFFGFPPHKKGRNKFFQKIVDAEYTAVFYESPHRILKTLRELQPTDKIVVCRELTKKFETIYRGDIEIILKLLTQDKNQQKGEFVIIIDKRDK
ncbi:MAG: 16S rRNA (cytidine(1402)-2'-O)-methyltransferase [Patescibacteria group bacterium]